jgi:hypothetical protein
MSDQFVRFAGWTQGDAGRVDPAFAGPMQWYGDNVQLYNSGLIGPRWGLKRVTVSGSLTLPGANGPRGFATVGNNLLITTDRTYLAPLSTLETGAVSTTAFATYPAAPTGWVTFVPMTDALVYALVNDVLYQHNTGTFTTTAVATPATFSFIRRWNLYCAAVDKTTKYRLWFSEVSAGGFNFSSWPAANYLDIGDNEPITAIVPMYNTLFVGKRSGWWAVTGVIGEATVRQISSGDGPVDARGASATADNRIAYWPKSPNPAFFNGSASSVMLDHVTATYNPSAAQAVTASPTGRTNLFGFDTGTNSRALLIAALGGASYHTFAQRLAGFAPDVISNGYGLPAGYVLAAKQSSIAGEALEVYAWQVDPDRPPLSGDTLGSYGDSSNTPIVAGFRTRAHYDGQGRDVRARSIIVRFRAWGVGSSTNKLRPGFGVSIEALGPYEDASATSQVQSWRVPYGQVSQAGQDFTVRFGLGEQGFGAGFRVVVSNMVGVAIRDIVVGVDTRGQRA